MSKPKTERALKDTEAQAVARMIRVSPQKLNLVAAMIRGKKVATALAELTFSRKRVAQDVKKALESAIANAEHNDGADIDELRVTSIYVEQGATLKRFTARAKGRGNRISKPTAHIYVTVGN